MGLSRLSEVLWSERNLLEILLFKLEEEHLLLAGGRSRWLGRATREVEAVVEELRAVELQRAVLVDDVALLLGLPVEPTLAQLAAAAPAPWDDLLRDHRMAFLALTREVQQTAEANRGLLAAGFRASREGLLALSGGALAREEGGYSRSGRKSGASTASQLLDQAF